MDCPARNELLQLALEGASAVARPADAAHVQRCSACRSEVDRLREAAGTLAAAVAVESIHHACLDEHAISMLADGLRAPDSDAEIEHLARCEACRRRLATVAALMGDDDVAAERGRLEPRDEPAGVRALDGARSLRALHRPGVRTALASAAVTVVVAGALLRPDPSARTDATAVEAPALHRESAITTTTAPRILGPGGPTTIDDSLRWTAVPHADRYQVMVFDREGTLVWDPQTSATSLPLAAHLRRDTTTTYLWKVEARTGWDRWVASEWEYLTIGMPERPR